MSPPAKHSIFTTTTTTTNQKRSAKNSHSNQNSKKSKSDCNYNQTAPAVYVKSEVPSVNTEEESDYIMAPKYDYSENEDSFNVKDSSNKSGNDQGAGGTPGDTSIPDQGRSFRNVFACI